MDNTIDGKVCTKCGAWKERTEFRHRAGRCGGYLEPKCKQCERDYSRIQREANKELVYSRTQDWRKRNPEAIRKNHKDWALAHPEAVKRSLEHLRNWPKNNPEKYKAWRKRWIAENIESVREYKRGSTKLRTQRRKTNGGRFDQEDWNMLLEIFGHKCLRCGGTENLCADHIVPVCKGGSDDAVNRQPLCPLCNAKKGTKIVDYRKAV